MQHVMQPCACEFFCNQNKHGVGSHETEKLPQLSFVALLEVRTKVNNFAVTTVLVILLAKRTTKVAQEYNKQKYFCEKEIYLYRVPHLCTSL